MGLIVKWQNFEEILTPQTISNGIQVKMDGFILVPNPHKHTGVLEEDKEEEISLMTNGAITGHFNLSSLSFSNHFCI